MKTKTRDEIQTLRMNSIKWFAGMDTNATEYSGRWIDFSNCPCTDKQAVFIHNSKLIHGDHFDYSEVEYVTSRTYVKLSCPKHGQFEQRPDSHLLGHGCSRCSDEKKAKNNLSNTKEFIIKAKSRHGHTYDYSDVEYKNYYTPVTISCSEHGKFEQTPNKHLRGGACPACDQYQGNTFGAYSEKAFDVNRDRRDWEGRLYVIRLSNEKESFLNYGITTNSIDKRSVEIRRVGYTVDVVREVHMNMFDAFTLEQQLVEQVCDYSYKPMKRFGGKTKCLVENSSVLSVIDDFLK